MAQECLANKSVINVVYSAGNKLAFNGRTSYPINELSATASLTFISGMVPAHDETITIKSSEGLSLTYTATSGATSSDTRSFSTQSASGVSEELRSCILHASGHHGQISATLGYAFASGYYDRLHLTQGVPGTSGNLNISNSLNAVIAQNFSGGVDSLKYGLSTGTYVFVNTHSEYPIAILDKGNSNISYTGNPAYKTTAAVSGTTSDGTYDFYYGPIIVNVTGNFNSASYYSSTGGYMGGRDGFAYDLTFLIWPHGFLIQKKIFYWHLEYLCRILKQLGQRLIGTA